MPLAPLGCASIRRRRDWSRVGYAALAAAMLVSVAVGAAIYWLVIVRGLPALAHRLSDEQILALRDGLRITRSACWAQWCLAAAALALPRRWSSSVSCTDR